MSNPKEKPKKKNTHTKKKIVPDHFKLNSNRYVWPRKKEKERKQHKKDGEKYEEKQKRKLCLARIQKYIIIKIKLRINININVFLVYDNKALSSIIAQHMWHIWKEEKKH